MSGLVEIGLTDDEALVLFGWLSDLDAQPRAEQAALDGLVAALESRLTAPFTADYADQLAAARARLAGD
ncbi:MAG: hypothetical protein QM608_17230 [Caulobacter sp.]